MESYVFHEEAEKFIIKTKDVMENMKEFNSEFHVTYCESKLVVDTGEKGQFIFEIDKADEKIMLVSPVSGVFHYEFDVETGEWISCLDRHDIRGLVTRDLLKHWKGCPKY